jgi:membrane protein YdbS with pleckstrin-like domain
MNLPVRLQPDESVILTVRRHPVYMIAKLIGIGLVALIPVGLALWLIGATAGFGGALGAVALVACAVWVLVWAIKGYLIWYTHRHDLWVITNQRLLDLYKRNPFDQRLSSADLVNVQDISIEKGGLLASVLNFGDVRCQTAGAESVFVLAGIPDPARALTVLDAARDAARQEGRGGGHGGHDRVPSDSVPGAAPFRGAAVSDRVPDAPRNPAAP